MEPTPVNTHFPFTFTISTCVSLLPLVVVGRSVGLHEPVSEGGDLFDCATVKEFSISEKVIVSSVRVEDMTNRYFSLSPTSVLHQLLLMSFSLCYRVAFAEEVAGDVTSPNNILILNQRVVGDCVETTMKVTEDDREYISPESTL